MTMPPAGAAGAAHNPTVITVDGTPGDDTPDETRAEDESMEG